MRPLEDTRVVEFEGLGPSPFAGMMLADLGAEVIRVERLPAAPAAPESPHPVLRGRRSVSMDLRSPRGRDLARRLVATADVLVEGYRPGTMERLGLGPETCLTDNPRLVYGRVTGWGQNGPLAAMAGHDINYIAMTGALHAIGRRGEAPVPPLNLLGDYAGGALHLVVGVLAALLEVGRSGTGQIVDAAMVDGVSSMMTTFHGLVAAGRWNDERGTNHLDSGAHFYDVYETRDRRWISLGAIEPKFYDELRHRLGLEGPEWDNQRDATTWEERTAALATVVRTRTRDEWCAVLDGTDVCFAPVLSLDEVPDHPHHVARKSFVRRDGVVHPAPAPRLSRTPAELSDARPVRGADTADVLHDLGVTNTELSTLVADGIVYVAQDAV